MELGQAHPRRVPVRVRTGPVVMTWWQVLIVGWLAFNGAIWVAAWVMRER